MTASRPPAGNQFISSPIELGSNQLALHALRDLSRLPSGGLLYLHGPTGVGKTLLIKHVLRTELGESDRESTVVTTGDEFAAEYARLTAAGDAGGFADRYRQLDWLIVEDVQGLKGRKESQQQLTFSIDEILAHSGRVIMTATRLPGEIPGLSARLRNRCRGGMTAELSLPTVRERSCLVDAFCQQCQLPIGPKGVRQIVQCSGATPRDLLASVFRIEARASLERSVQFDSEFLSRCFDDSIPAVEPAIKRIAVVVARHFDVAVADLRSPRRTRELVLARQCAMYLARLLTSRKLHEIARYFRRDNHSAVSHACQRIEDLLLRHPGLGQQLAVMRNNLK